MSSVVKYVKTIGVSVAALGGCYFVVRFIIHFRRFRQENRDRLTKNIEGQFTSYEYASLGDASSKNTRLIELLPGPEEDFGGNDPLRLLPRIRVKVVSLSDPLCLNYEAISYCWGTSSKECPVLCEDSRVIWITESLWEALWAFRLKNRSRLLWADAICINQENLDEKNWQVAQMTDVYRNATRVLVWLGSGRIGYKRLSNYVPQLVKAKELMDVDDCDLSWEQLSKEQLQKYGLPTNSLALSNLCLELICLTETDWFDRVWVVQEFIVAREVRLAFGEVELGWSDLETAYEFAGDKGLFWACGFTFHWSRMDQLVASKKMWTDDSEGSTLFYQLLLHQSTLATNPLDRVYALAGLASDKIFFQIDYRKSVAKLYWEATRNVLLNQQCLNILVCAGNPPSNELPSWVCDWRHRIESTPISGWTYTCPTNWSNLDIGSNEIDKNLLLSGFKIDDINGVSICAPTLPLKHTERFLFDNSFRVTQAQWFDFCSAGSGGIYELTGESLISVFFQLLIVQTVQDQEEWDKIIRARLNDVFDYLRFLNGCKKYIPLRKTWASYKAAMHILYFFWDAILHTLFTSGEGKCMDPLFIQDLMKSAGRTMIKTKDGLLGMAPKGARVGDEVFLLKGGRTPFVLRCTDKADEYLLIGECYIHGVMDGKFWDEEKCRSVTLV